MRTLYQCLIWLHPPQFRREFGEEMLWIFDESHNSSAAPLFADAFRSLARQWLLRAPTWRVAVALLLALFQVGLGGAGMLLLGRRGARGVIAIPPDSPWRTGLLTSHSPVTVHDVVFLAICIIAGLVTMLIFLVYWINKVAARRRLPTYRERLCSNYAR